MAQKYAVKNKKVKTVALAIALPNLAFAATEETVTQLPTIQARAEQNASYLAAKTSSTKRTETLLDTAKSVQVITEKALKDQGLLSLQQALATTPGISFGAGEGGGGYGDKINLRGYDATYNTTVDGLRDAALTNRSDLFNYEAVEVIKGANSVENGVGQISGGVNLVSKTPKKRDSNEVTLGFGSDSYKRFTGDFNKVVDDDLAFRLNVMGHQNTYAGREEEMKRWGIAPSLTFGISDTTKATLSYLYQKDENDPQYGVPYYNGKPVKGISDKNNYGYSNLDQQNIENQVVTLKLESEISSNAKLNSITRYSDIQQKATVSAPQGTFCLADGKAPTAFTNNNLTGFINCATAGQYVVSGPRGYYRDTHNKQFANDTNINVQFKTGLIDHTLVAGVGMSREDYEITTAGYIYNTNGTVPTKPNMDVYNPDHYWRGATKFTKTGVAEGYLNVYSAYLFDTLKFGEQWLLNLGVRNDYTDGQYRSDTISTTNAAVTRGQNYKQSDNLISYNTGLTFKPTPATSLYLSYANAQKPVQNTASGGCAQTITNNVITANTCNTDPENAVAYEIGAKWQANPNFLLSAAVFRNEQDKVRVRSDIAGQPDAKLDGKNYVQGVELGLAGEITPKWNITASAAYMEGEYDQTKVNGSPNIDFQKGDKLVNVPKVSGSLWTTYQLNDQWQAGYGLTYQGEMYLSTHSAATNDRVPQVKSEDYLIHNASVTYSYNRDLSFQLLGQNLSDEKYYTHIRNNGWAMPGEGRKGVFNVNYKF
ncbi:TonB-dependent receptor [Acinetobacter nematophilus]|uniref:TonB-dependent siderophore receptor n=1 Tax=Acinetobacter nematophilus TaxID=2994642 RepID=A0A9X3IIS3_9GAMM|nr:TonB-dependent siderophore receptor [Acinetobacter nematophilus]MCX5469521.1 TonB-dependent siderophore receptor [Acinetobacter nematophilus]